MTINLNILSHKRVKLIGLCLFVVIIIVLVWLRSASVDVELFVPVELGDMPFGLTLTHQPVKGVEVRASGPKYLIKALPDLRRSYFLDLAQVKIGRNRIEFQQDNLHLPEGIAVVEITPPTLVLEVDRAIQKEVPVMVAVSGKPAKGFILSDAVARPPSVILNGPESLLSPVEKVMTKAIDIGGVSESLKKEIALDLNEMLVIESPKTMFIAEVFIEAHVISKEFQDIPVAGENTLLDYSITPSTINIEINGPMNVLERIDLENDIQAYVDLKTLSPGVYARPVVISLPVQTTLISVNPEIFTVTLK